MTSHNATPETVVERVPSASALIAAKEIIAMESACIEWGAVADRSVTLCAIALDEFHEAMSKTFPSLSAAVNLRAGEIYAGGSPQDLADAKDLIRALARLLSGESLRSAFGSPGDWGYNTSIGVALAEAYRADRPSSPAHNEVEP